MFAVLFEVQPKADQWDAYLEYAQDLKPKLQEIDGFIDNIRYRSLTRDGWLLSLSNWRDEKSLVRWRTQEDHHTAQEKGRVEVFQDYHLRVGQLTRDTDPPEGLHLLEQRLDETEAGIATTVTLVSAAWPADLPEDTPPEDLAACLGLTPDITALLEWDVFEAVLEPGQLILLMSWRDDSAGRDHERTTTLPDQTRLRRVRIVRDYGMYDRREAPQYYAAVDKH